MSWRRTEPNSAPAAVEKVVAQYPDMKIVEKQIGNFQRERGLDLMNNWLTAGTKIDAVAANNDEMAIGAIMAIRQAGIPAGKILVGGVDATPDALAEAGERHVGGDGVSKRPRTGERRGGRRDDTRARRAS